MSWFAFLCPGAEEVRLRALGRIDALGRVDRERTKRLAPYMALLRSVRQMMWAIESQGERPGHVVLAPHDVRALHDGMATIPSFNVSGMTLFGLPISEGEKTAVEKRA